MSRCLQSSPHPRPSFGLAAAELTATCSEHYVKFYEPLPWQQVKRRTHDSRIPKPKVVRQSRSPFTVGGSNARVGPNDPEYLLRLLMPFLSATKSERNISWLVSHHRWQIFEVFCLLQLISDEYYVILYSQQTFIIEIFPENPLNWL